MVQKKKKFPQTFNQIIRANTDKICSSVFNVERKQRMKESMKSGEWTSWGPMFISSS